MPNYSKMVEKDENTRKSQGVSTFACMYHIPHVPAVSRTCLMVSGIPSNFPAFAATLVSQLCILLLMRARDCVTLICVGVQMHIHIDAYMNVHSYAYYTIDKSLYAASSEFTTVCIVVHRTLQLAHGETSRYFIHLSIYLSIRASIQSHTDTCIAMCVQTLTHERNLVLPQVSGLVTTAMPTFTNPNNVGIMTGVTPDEHGISGNYYYDREADAEVCKRVCTGFGTRSKCSAPKTGVHGKRRT